MSFSIRVYILPRTTDVLQGVNDPHSPVLMPWAFHHLAVTSPVFTFFKCSALKREYSTAKKHECLSARILFIIPISGDSNLGVLHQFAVKCSLVPHLESCSFWPTLLCFFVHSYGFSLRNYVASPYYMALVGARALENQGNVRVFSPRISYLLNGLSSQSRHRSPRKSATLTLCAYMNLSQSPLLHF